MEPYRGYWDESFGRVDERLRQIKEETPASTRRSRPRSAWSTPRSTTSNPSTAATLRWPPSPLSAEDGRTTVTTTTFYPTKEVRDIVLGSGMEDGAAESHDRLAEHLETLA